MVLYLRFLNLRVHTSVGFCSILKVLDELSKWGSEGESPQPLIRGCSSAGRAPALHAGGQEFDPPHLHQERVWNGDWLPGDWLPKCGLIAQLVRAHD